jgi:hypothetical protein
MEAQIFHPDSTRFVLHRSADAHHSDQDDPAHRYLLCDLDNGGELISLTEETGVTAPSLSPDGEWLYYFVDETHVVGPSCLTLKRVRLDGAERETMLALDTPIPGTNMRPSFIYPLSTISSDGKRIALPAFLRYGEREDLPWGLMVFYPETGLVQTPIWGPTWTNMHAQYCRATDPIANRDLMVQHNHSHFFDRDGERHFSPDGLGNDIHVVRDDGTNWRALPWGRNGLERQGGHQCWIGQSHRALSIVAMVGSNERRLIAGSPTPSLAHQGAQTPGAQRTDLSRAFDLHRPRFSHFGLDAQGVRIISDEYPEAPGGEGWLYLGDMPQDEQGAIENWVPLLDTRSSWAKEAHPHPFLSPDGTMGFFNSDESGILQAYMIRGWS